MKSLLTRSVAAVALCSALGVAASGVAYANGGSPHAYAASSVDHAAHSSLNANDRSAPPSSKKSFGQLQRQYRDALRTINREFEQSVAAAQSQFVSSLVSARTAADKLAARTQFRNAVAGATAKREVALKGLGRPPHRGQSGAGSRGRSN
ncbi:MAG TPA: hypothetical protein VMV53_07305 [Acidimicrobiales bacterium]|nr:hypothetical protein [Acidimicrobiales bacterium]